MIKRVLVVVLCYLFSSIGFFASLAGALEEFNRPSGNSFQMLMAISWIVAWCIHIFMCFTWVLDIRIGKLLPYLGCVVGVVSLLSFSSPGIEMFKNAPALGTSLAIVTPFFSAIFVAPAIFLALHMTNFHGKVGNNA